MYVCMCKILRVVSFSCVRSACASADLSVILQNPVIALWSMEMHQLRFLSQIWWDKLLSTSNFQLFFAHISISYVLKNIKVIDFKYHTCCQGRLGDVGGLASVAPGPLASIWEALISHPLYCATASKEAFRAFCASSSCTVASCLPLSVSASLVWSKATVSLSSCNHIIPCLPLSVTK